MASPVIAIALDTVILPLDSKAGFSSALLASISLVPGGTPLLGDSGCGAPRRRAADMSF